MVLPNLVLEQIKTYCWFLIIEFRAEVFRLYFPSKVAFLTLLIVYSLVLHISSTHLSPS